MDIKRFLPAFLIFTNCVWGESMESRIEKLPITVVVPAYCLSPECHSFLKKMKVRIHPDVLKGDNYLGSPATDLERTQHFIEVANSYKEEIIWGARGGYGSYRLKYNLFDTDLKKRKTFVGYSDLTAMNIPLSQKFGWFVIHGPVFKELFDKKSNEAGVNILLSILEKKIEKYQIPNIKSLNKKGFNISQDIKGKITGGNLTLIETGIGTKYQIDTNNKILFLEDVGENNQSVFRSLWHLKECGLLANTKAIVFGEFLESTSSEQTSSVMRKFLEQFAETVNIPVFITDSFGHGKKNYPLIYEANTIISKSGKNFSMTILCNFQ